jgi:hypothetical protein
MQPVLNSENLYPVSSVWQQLFPESGISFHIISHLELESDVPSFALVCKAWHAVFQKDDNVWRRGLQRDFAFYQLKPGETCQEVYQRLYFNFKEGRGTLNIIDQGIESLDPQNHGEVVNALAVKEGILFSGHSNGDLKCWDTKTFKHAAQVFGSGVRTQFPASVNALAVEGCWLASSFSEQSVGFYNLNTRVQRKLNIGAPAEALAVSGNHLFIGQSDGTVIVYDMENNKHVRRWQPGLANTMGPMRSIVINNHQNLFVLYDKALLKCKNWIVDNSIEAILRAKPGASLSCLTLFDSQFALLALDKKISLWDFSSEKAIHLGSLDKAQIGETISSLDPISSLCSCDDKRVAGVFKGGNVGVWNLERHKAAISFRVFDNLQDDAQCMTFGDGKLFIGLNSGKIAVYDFTARCDQILKEIIMRLATGIALEGTHSTPAANARMQFEKLPKEVKEGFLAELGRVLKSSREGYEGNPQDAFYGRNTEQVSDIDLFCAASAYLAQNLSQQ